MNGLLVVVNFDQELEIGRFLEDLRRTDHRLDVVVVDDGSRDRSPEIAEDLGYAVIRHSRNCGVGAAIRTGIRHALSQASYDFVLIMSSNGKMKPGDLKTVVAPVVEGRADYVQGTRFGMTGKTLGLPLFRALAIPAYSMMASLILRRRFTDITCGFRAYRLWIVQHPRVRLDQPWLDRYEAELYIHYYACRLGARIVEVPVTIDYSHLTPGRTSKMRPFSGWWSLLRPFLLLATGLRS
jgi:dolichol-phosphate mannosyltransferase